MQVFPLYVCFHGYRSLLTFVAVGSVRSVGGGVLANSSAAPARSANGHLHSVCQKDTMNIYGKICIHQCRPKDWGIHNIYKDTCVCCSSFQWPFTFSISERYINIYAEYAHTRVGAYTGAYIIIHRHIHLLLVFPMTM